MLNLDVGLGECCVFAHHRHDIFLPYSWVEYTVCFNWAISSKVNSRPNRMKLGYKCLFSLGFTWSFCSISLDNSDIKIHKHIIKFVKKHYKFLLRQPGFATFQRDCCFFVVLLLFLYFRFQWTMFVCLRCWIAFGHNVIYVFVSIKSKRCLVESRLCFSNFFRLLTHTHIFFSIFLFLLMVFLCVQIILDAKSFDMFLYFVEHFIELPRYVGSHYFLSYVDRITVAEKKEYCFLLREMSRTFVHFVSECFAIFMR